MSKKGLKIYYETWNFLCHCSIALNFNNISLLKCEPPLSIDYQDFDPEKQADNDVSIAKLPTSRLKSEISDYLLYCRLSQDYFYICLKLTFSLPILTQPASTLEFLYFYSILQKKNVGRDKNGKSVPSQR